MIILGHSLGGAVATKAVCHILKTEFNQDLYDKIQGIIIIDVIEGSAMEALPFMMNVVQKRENNFDSINSAIYYMSHTQIRNVESCRISIPPLCFLSLLQILIIIAKNSNITTPTTTVAKT